MILGLSPAFQARHSEYVSTKPQGPGLSALLVSGEFPLLLRCSLDESGIGLQVAALKCLHSLLVSSPEEQLLDKHFSSFFGLSLPALSPQRGDKASKLAEKTDLEVMKKDVVKVGKEKGYCAENAKGMLCHLNIGTFAHATVAEAALSVGSVSASHVSESADA